MEKKSKIVPLSLKVMDSETDIDNIIRLYPDLEDSRSNILGVVEGVASVFGNIDSYGEITDKGAFEETIVTDGPRGKNRVKFIPMHNFTKFPIGRILDLRETEEGLEFKAVVFATEGELGGKNAFMVIKGGAVTELSYGFNTLEYEKDEVEGQKIKRLKKVQLWEISPVLWGANDQTRFKSMEKKHDIEAYFLEEEQEKKAKKKAKEFLEKYNLEPKKIVLDGKEKDIFVSTKDGLKLSFSIEGSKNLFISDPEKFLKHAKTNISVKNIDPTDSLNYMLKEAVINEPGYEGYCGINLIFVDKFIYNNWYYGDSEEESFDIYYMRDYSVVNGDVILSGEKTEVKPTTTFVEKSNEKIKNRLKKKEVIKTINELKDFFNSTRRNDK